MSARGTLAVIAFEGELDVGRKEELRRTLVIDPTARAILLDLSLVTYADSTALSEMLQFAVRAEQHSIPIAVLTTNPQFNRVIRYAGIGDALPLFGDRGEALTHLGSGGIVSLGELRLRREALPDTPAPMRHALVAFLRALSVVEDARIDIETAVGEALANAVEHAYREGRPGDIELSARLNDSSQLTVAVADRGSFRLPTERTDRGFGLRIIHAVAQLVQVESDGSGTRIHMVFSTAR